MIHKVNSVLVGGYLLLCILLGGSAQVEWPNLALQLLGIALLAWSAIAPRDEFHETRGSLAVEILVAATFVVVLLQLIPLPSGIWQSLPGRERIASGFQVLGYPVPSLPVSATPYLSVQTVFAAIPAVAALFATDKLRPSPRAIAGAVIVGTLLAIIIGVVQVGERSKSWAYFYSITNPGAVGFFANRNHMATLLLVAIPLAAALSASGKSDRRSAIGKNGVLIALLAVIALGIVLNGSITGYGLVIPVVLASVALVPAGLGLRRFALPIAGLMMVGGVILLVTKPIAAVETATNSSSSSITTRTAAWQTTIEAIAETMPVGTGLGSFQQVYRQHESPADVGRFYVNHAHNDYLEIVLELGAAGAILLLLFLCWWGIVSVRIWKSALSTPFARAATVATAAVLAHSVVDFPLRTAAISAIFAACVGLMTQHLRSAPAAKASELRPTRHVKLG